MAVAKIYIFQDADIGTQFKMSMHLYYDYLIPLETIEREWQRGKEGMSLLIMTNKRNNVKPVACPHVLLDCRVHFVYLRLLP